jgi:hypothetical protein
MGTQLGYAFIRLDVPFNGATVQVRVLPDLIDGSLPFLQNIFSETAYDIELVREVEPGNFLLDTPFFARSVQDPYLAAVDPTLRILELDFQANASTRDPHSTLSGRGAFYLVIYGQAFGEPTLLGYYSGRLAIEVSADSSGPLGADPRATLWGPNWRAFSEPGDIPPPTQPVGPGGAQSGAGGGTAGPDQLVGGAGNETLDGGGGQDFIRGGDGNDSINGGADFDDTHGNMGNDTVAGGLGDDWVVGGKGDDALFGDDGGDIVLGNIGADTCDGGAGADIVRGGQDNDIVRGGAGDDYVSGDRGSDTVTGGRLPQLRRGGHRPGHGLQPRRGRLRPPRPRHAVHRRPVRR